MLAWESLAIQFCFNFSSEQIKKFKDFKNKITLSIDHPMYNHNTEILPDVRKALMLDFS